MFDSYLSDNDRIAYMRFNNQQMIDFELNEKGTNEVYLRRAIQDSLEIKAQH